MGSTAKVAVTGFGLISSLGRGPEINARALREGSSGIISRRPEWQQHKLRSQVSGNIEAEPLRALFDRKQSRFLCNAGLLAATAMADAISHAGLAEHEVQSPRTGIVIGAGGGTSLPDAFDFRDRFDRRGGAKVGSYFLPRIMGSSVSANLGCLFHIRGHSYGLTSACSTSAHALMHGMDLIRSGRQDRVFAGGTDDVNVFSAAAFDGMNALSSAFNDEPQRASRPLDRARDGFVCSGGAAVVVLENLQTAQARRAKVWAMLEGAGATCDGEDMVVPSGLGGQVAMTMALADAKCTTSQIDYINLHGTSTPIGDVKEVEAIREVFGSNVPPLSSTKSMTGHGLGAAGAHEAIFCILMMHEGFLAPNINLEDPEPMVRDLPVVTTTCDAVIGRALTNSFGFGGTNCCLVLSQYERGK